MHAEWFADEAFWQDGYGVMFSDDAFRQAPEQVDHLLTLTGVRQGTALDLCCGPGRHAVALAKRGFDVTGVDLSHFLIGRARAHASAQDATLTFVQADMRSFVRPNTFDLIVNLFTSFGYFDDASDDRHVVRNIHDSLRPNGVVVLDMNGKELIAQRWGNRVIDLPDGSVCIQRIKIIDDWTRIQSEWIFVKDGLARSYHFRHRLYSGQELRSLLEEAGFAVTLFGHLDGRPYGPDSARLIAVGRKIGR